MEWQTLMQRGLAEGKLRELYLYQIPSLKTCDNWALVKEIGKIDFKGKHATYTGGLVTYADTTYFVPEARIAAVAPYRKWNFKNNITIITEEEHKKKKGKI